MDNYITDTFIKENQGQFKCAPTKLKDENCAIIQALANRTETLNAIQMLSLMTYYKNNNNLTT